MINAFTTKEFKRQKANVVEGSGTWSPETWMLCVHSWPCAHVLNTYGFVSVYTLYVSTETNSCNFLRCFDRVTLIDLAKYRSAAIRFCVSLVAVNTVVAEVVPRESFKRPPDACFSNAASIK